MKTIKLPINIHENDLPIIFEYTRLQNNITRISYNRFKDNYSEKDIRSYLKRMNLSSDLINIDSWFIQSGIYKAKEMFLKDETSFKTNGTFPKRIFGGKFNLRRRCKNLISNQEYKSKKQLPLLIIGEAPKSGNRKFNFHNTNEIIFKPSIKQKIDISLPKLRNNLKKELSLLIKHSNQKSIAYQIQLSKNFIWITFDDEKLYNLESSASASNSVKNRYCGIDLNPNYIGFSVFDSLTSKFICKEIISLKKLTGKKYSSGKLDYETKEIFHYIGRKLRSLNCEYVFLEDLSFKSGNKKKGKNFNRLTINQWNRNIPEYILRKYFKSKLFKVNAAYSSTIGNCVYSDPDPVSAANEIGRRGFEVIIVKKRSKEGASSFYPEFDLKMVREEIRNQTAHLELNSWKELHSFLKNSKMMYRVPLPKEESFRKFKSVKSLVYVI